MAFDLSFKQIGELLLAILDLAKKVEPVLDPNEKTTVDDKTIAFLDSLVRKIFGVGE